MSAKIELLAWDFDGVLNRNSEAGRLVWYDDFEADLGQSPERFQAAVFGANYQAVMTGAEDIRDRVANWAREVGFAPGADALLAYWFEKDARPDPALLALMEGLSAHGLRQVIATNNEPRRTRYIETEMGFAARVERVFSSGRMRIAKPDPGFFRHLAEATGVPPEAILLVDDSAANVAAARGQGWQALQHRGDAAELAARLLAD